MALYEYDLYLIRECNKSIINDLKLNKFVDIFGNSDGKILNELDFCFVEKEIDRNSFTILSIYFDETQFRKYFEKNGKIFFEWLIEILKDNNILYAFISGGDNSDYYRDNNITSKIVFNQLSEFLNNKILKIIHPLMFFSKRLNFDINNNKKNDDFPFDIININDKGHIFFFGDINSNNNEIFDFGFLYKDFLYTTQKYLTSKL